MGCTNEIREARAEADRDMAYLQSFHTRLPMRRTKARRADSYPEGLQKRMDRPQVSRQVLGHSDKAQRRRTGSEVEEEIVDIKDSGQV